MCRRGWRLSSGLDSTGQSFDVATVHRPTYRLCSMCTGRPRIARTQAPPTDTPELKIGTLKGKS